MILTTEQVDDFLSKIENEKTKREYTLYLERCMEHRLLEKSDDELAEWCLDFCKKNTKKKNGEMSPNSYHKWLKWNSKVFGYFGETERHEYWKNKQHENNTGALTIKRNERLKNETVINSDKNIKIVKKSNTLKPNERLILLLYLQGACVRTDIVSVRADVVCGSGTNYVDYSNKRIVYNWINKVKLEEPIVIDDLDEDTWKLIEERRGKEWLVHMTITNRNNGLSILVNKATTKAFGKPIGVNKLRATYEANAIANGMDREVVARRMGHSVKTALEHYDRRIDNETGNSNRFQNLLVKEQKPEQYDRLIKALELGMTNFKMNIGQYTITCFKSNH